MNKKIELFVINNDNIMYSITFTANMIWNRAHIAPFHQRCKWINVAFTSWYNRVIDLSEQCEKTESGGQQDTL